MSNECLISQHAPNILVVDDVPANLKILGDILEDEGYIVRPVLTGKLALQVSEKEIPDLILLDIMMPDMDGYEVCHRLKKNQILCDVPVIFISALIGTNDIVKALNAGGADYLTKPFKAEEVKARVATHLKLYQQRKELLAQSNELIELNATKDKFFSIIAHDLRGPFTSLLGFTRMMEEDIFSMTHSEIHKIAVVLNKSTTNLFNLLENLLEWARMQRGITIFVPESFLLLEKINECILPTIDSAHRKNIELLLNIPDTMQVCADERMFEALVRNLTSNAVKFTPKGGKIIVSAKPSDNNFIEISIRDSGIGMNKEMIDNLFKLDELSGRKGTEGEPSTGLGLIICKDFIEKHGGRIWVDSEEGKGSTFYFTLKQ
ncbi:MAG: hybrid sensor histidine kinase/response regulator [Bacteroidota bacterium]